MIKEKIPCCIWIHNTIRKVHRVFDPVNGMILFIRADNALNINKIQYIIIVYLNVTTENKAFLLFTMICYFQIREDVCQIRIKLAQCTCLKATDSFIL